MASRLRWWKSPDSSEHEEAKAALVRAKVDLVKAHARDPLVTASARRAGKTISQVQIEQSKNHYSQAIANAFREGPNR